MSLINLTRPRLEVIISVFKAVLYNMSIRYTLTHAHNIIIVIIIYYK